MKSAISVATNNTLYQFRQLQWLRVATAGADRHEPGEVATDEADWTARAMGISRVFQADGRQRRPDGR
jgi:hypothetical protein